MSIRSIVLGGFAAAAWSGVVGAYLLAPIATVSAAESGVPSEVRDFDIPAQPLDSALIQYGNASGYPVLFPSDLVAGRTSTAVRGRYSSDAALRRLLAETGVVMEKRDSDLGPTYVLRAVSPPAGSAAGMDGLFRDRAYPGLVQAGILQALCADPRTAPGHYRALFRFQLDASGRLKNAVLLHPTGDDGRDRALLAALQHVRIGRPTPPALVENRLTMLLRPDDAGASCQEQGTAARGR